MNQRARKLFILLLLAGVYFLGGKVGLSLAFAHTNATPIWPPAGIALAAILILGPWVWPAILAGAFAVNFTTGDTSAAASLGIAVGNTLEAVLGGLLVKEYAGGAAAFDRPQNIFKFVFLAALLSTAVSATVGTTITSIQTPSRWELYAPVWFTWWLGDMVSNLTIAPLLLIWSTRPLRRFTGARLGELAAILCLILLLGLGMFAGWFPAHSKNYPLEYLTIPLLLWAAFRFGQRTVIVATLLMATLALRGTLRGYGPFAVVSVNESLLLLQAFVGIITITLLVLAAALSDRRLADAAMRESENRLRAIVDNSTAVIFLKDVQGRYLMVNRQWEQVTGISRARAMGKTGRDVFPSDTAQHLNDDDRTVIERATPVQFEEKVPNKNDERTFITVKFPLFDDSGSVYAVCGIATDISDRTKAESERIQLLDSERAARAEAERANRLKDEFLATVSHELRTPLNAILGWAQLLTTGKSTDEDLAYGLETIERNARAQAQLVEDLLDMSRIISGKIRLDLQRVHLPVIVTSACNSVGPMAEAKKLSVHCTIEPAVPSVWGDPLRLQQVALNLLSNAVKFTPAGGSITVTLDRTGDDVQLTVTDTGRGIQPDFLPHIFERFRQADAPTTRAHGGVGLGLSIVKHLVDLHSGTITAHSDGDGRGATFIVRLPLAPVTASSSSLDPSRVSPASASRAAASRDLSRMKILVVDDEPDARDLARRILEEAHASIRTAASCAEALQLIQQDKPDLLLSDIGMPIEDGYSLLTKLRALPPSDGGNIPAIALTAFARPEDRQRALAVGFQAHVSKPIQAQSLTTTIADLMARRPAAPVM
jgi:PAS domain S-box-containing protein